MTSRRRWRSLAISAAALVCVVAMLTPPGSARAEDTPRHRPAADGEEGFVSILDGSATGGAASFDQWHQIGGGPTSGFSLQPNGAVRSEGADGGGQLMYPAEFGDVFFRLEYRDAIGTEDFSNGGIFVRFPVDQLCTPVLPATPACTTVTSVDDRPTHWVYDWGGLPGPYPPPQTYMNDPVNGDAATGFRAYCSRSHNPPQRVAINCGHEIQVNDSPDGGTLDPIKTGSIYNMANLDATSGNRGSGAQARLDADAAAGWTPGQPRAWHDVEIHIVGQQYTVLIDGEVVNEYDNTIPLQPARANDPPSQARQFATGGFAVQDHGSSVIEYRDIRVMELTRPPVSVRAPRIVESRRHGAPLTCTPGSWRNVHDDRRNVEYEWFRSNQASQVIGDLAPTEEEYGHELVGTDSRYLPTGEDLAPGKVLWCRVTATTHQGTAWATAVPRPDLIRLRGTWSPVNRAPGAPTPRRLHPSGVEPSA